MTSVLLWVAQHGYQLFLVAFPAAALLFVGIGMALFPHGIVRTLGAGFVCIAVAVFGLLVSVDLANVPSWQLAVGAALILMAVGGRLVLREFGHNPYTQGQERLTRALTTLRESSPAPGHHIRRDG